MSLRLPQTFVRIGITGESCTGKTTVANLLGRRLDLPVRHCGQQVARDPNQAAEKSPDVPWERHREVDQETRRIVSTAHGGIVVEGCFLEYVLDQTAGVFLVRLECDHAERLRRADAKELDLDFRDRADQLLISSVYDEHDKRSPDLRVDTGGLAPDEAEENIFAALVGRGGQP